MKETASPILSVLLLVLVGLSQIVVDNPPEPKSENAGRSIKLTQVLKISDESDAFYFRYPHDIEVSPHGYIFICDENQLLQFSSEGEYVRNLFKKGKGPGELEYLSGYVLTDSHIILYNLLPNKVLTFDYNGEYVDEFRVETKIRFLKMFAYVDGIYFFFKSDTTKFEKETEITDRENRIVTYHPETKRLEEFDDFPTKIWKVKYGTGQGTRSINDFNFVQYDKSTVFVSHTTEYLVKSYDIRSKRILFEFKREYRRVKTPDEVKHNRRSEWDIGGKSFRIPYLEYLDDIRDLEIHRNRLWVITSTFDNNEGFLVDVFSIDGNYVHNFFLKIPGNISYTSLGEICVLGDHLYQIRRNEEELYEVIMYKIPNVNF